MSPNRFCSGGSVRFCYLKNTCFENTDDSMCPEHLSTYSNGIQPNTFLHPSLQNLHILPDQYQRNGYYWRPKMLRGAYFMSFHSSLKCSHMFSLVRETWRTDIQGGANMRGGRVNREKHRPGPRNTCDHKNWEEARVVFVPPTLEDALMLSLSLQDLERINTCFELPGVWWCVRIALRDWLSACVSFSQGPLKAQHMSGCCLRLKENHCI